MAARRGAWSPVTERRRRQKAAQHRLGDPVEFKVHGHRLYENSMGVGYVCTCGHAANTVEEHDAHVATAPRELRRVPKDWHRADGPFVGCACEDCEAWREGFPGIAERPIPRGMTL